MSLTHALKWSFLSELASKAVPPVVFIILARLLTPEDYGVMSSALMVISFSQIFWDAGMGKAIIQRQTDIGEAANVGFWINIGMGCIIATMLYVIAAPVAEIFFHDQRVTAVLQVMTIQVFFGAVSSVHTALLQKEMGFKKLFWVRFATVSLPGLASIPLALKGMGYWALVAGTLTGQMAQVIMLWIMSGWRPKFCFNTKLAGELLQFGAWVGASGLLAWFYLWADSLIVGMYLGSHDLGLYRTGNQFASMIYSLLFGPVAPVLYSQLSKMNALNKGLSEIVSHVMRLFIIIAIPVGMLVYSIQNEIELYVFGNQWIGVGSVIGVMSLTHGISYITSLNGEAYRAAGKPKYETLVMALPIPIYLFVYIIIAPYGIDAFLIGRFLVMLIIATGINLWLAKRLFNIKILDVVTNSIFVLLVSVVFVLYRSYFILFIDAPWVVMLLIVICGGFTVGLIIYFTQQKEIKSFYLLMEHKYKQRNV